ADATNRANRELFSAPADDAAARVLNVLGDKVGQFAERHIHVGERFRLGLNDELLFVAAALVDFGDARHGAQKWLDNVFLDLAQPCLIRPRLLDYLPFDTALRDQQRRRGLLLSRFFRGDPAGVAVP